MHIILYVMHPGVFGFAKVKIPVLYYTVLHCVHVCKLFKVSPKGPQTPSMNLLPLSPYAMFTYFLTYFLFNTTTQNTERRVSFSLSVHNCCSCYAVFNSFSFSTAPFRFSASKVFLTSPLTSVCQQSYSHNQLFSKQCMVLTLR